MDRSWSDSSEIVARVVGDALESGDAVAAIATRSHREALDERLRQMLIEDP